MCRVGWIMHDSLEKICNASSSVQYNGIMPLLMPTSLNNARVSLNNARVSLNNARVSLNNARVS